MTRARLAVLLPSALLLGAAAALAQRGAQAVDEATFAVNNVPYDGRFTFVRVRYTPARTGYGGGGGYFGGINYQWDHDYPRADQHFTTIIRELTAIRPAAGSNIIGIGSPDLMRYPVAHLVEPGWWTMTDAEALNLRAYLLKGGMLVLDDFVGSNALGNAERQLRRVIPDMRFIPLDVRHPVFHSFFEIASLDFQHPYQGVSASFLGVFEDNDPAKRLLAIVNFNNDLMESWEWSDTGYLPIDLTNQAYRLGINYVVYALTH